MPEACRHGAAIDAKRRCDFICRQSVLQAALPREFWTPSLESLDDLAACIAVAADIAPDAYPAWSDGFRAHFSATMLLWGEIRPQLRRDLEMAQRTDVGLLKMATALEVGDPSGFQEAARALLGLDVSKLR